MRPRLVAAIALGLVGLFPASAPEAHKAITSKYTYNDEVFPIIERRCAGCHVPGGIAPMSLVSYNDAYPWAESIKEEVINLRMPPWPVDDEIGRVAGSQALSAREIDILLEWSWGGTPEGDPRRRPAPALSDTDWALGSPDAILAGTTDGGLPADRSRGTSVFDLSPSPTDDRWIEAIDVKPGNAAIVRHATVWVVRDDSRYPLVLWVPGRTPVVHQGKAYRLPADASLQLEVHYRKTWTYEGLETPDRTAVGLYWASQPTPVEIRRLPVATMDADGPTAVDLEIDEGLDVLAVAIEGQSAEDVRVAVVRPDGDREDLVHLVRAPVEWQRSYTLESPVALPKGTRVEMSARVERTPPDGAASGGLRLWLDVVASPPTSAAR